MVNAPLDWLSLGVTRGFLRETLLRKQWWWGIIFSTSDLILALLLMVPLILLAVATMGVANMFVIAGGGMPIVHLPNVLDSIRENPGSTDHIWIYFMVFTTLIPTFLHAVIASVGFTLGLFQAATTSYIKTDARPGKGLYHTHWTPYWVSACVTLATFSLLFLCFNLLMLDKGLIWLGTYLLNIAGWMVETMGIAYPPIP